MNRWAARLSLWFWIIVLVVTLIFVPLCFGPVKAPQSRRDLRAHRRAEAMGKRRRKALKAPQAPICTILGCGAPAITVIRMHGSNRVWYGCSSLHVRSLLLDIREKYPLRHGITLKGVGSIEQRYLYGA